ncbi:hypothetical protein IFM89_012601 [Coptis chinensis]|uniref:RNase H type-1 domain-containing protein n=1 Tax=Coptis chinensis TaxID=261450 RepID=A0A835MB19_9MAGN|nr:hypothetical protein IFM89_012601 [Coptis chinensis]
MGLVSKAIRVAYGELDGHMDNTVTDLNTLKNLGLNTKARMAPKMLECYWYLPPRGIMKMNTDGAARGNPGIAGWGVVFRDHDGTVKGTYIGGIGVATNYVAECTSIIEGINLAIQQWWQHIWVDIDSVAATKTFQADKVLWKLRAQWDKIKHSGIWLHSPALGEK